MSSLDFFYGGGRRAEKATRAELIEHTKELREVLARLSPDLTLVGVNKYYKWHCAVTVPGDKTIYTCSVIGGHMIRMDGRMGYGYSDPWEGAPNIVKVEEIELGQMELMF